jgi:hypothetical protein
MTNSEFFNGMAERWDEIAVHPADKIRRIATLADPRRGAFVLDVGCGTGVMLPSLLDGVGREGRVVALDIAPAMIEIARRKYDSPNSCLPHFEDRRAFLSHARRLLAKGGRLAIAHCEGRASINALPAHVSDGPPSVPLPPIAALLLEAEETGFSIELSRDDEDYYILVAVADS